MNIHVENYVYICDLEQIVCEFTANVHLQIDL